MYVEERGESWKIFDFSLNLVITILWLYLTKSMKMTKEIESYEHACYSELLFSKLHQIIPKRGGYLYSIRDNRDERELDASRDISKARQDGRNREKLNFLRVIFFPLTMLAILEDNEN